MQLIYSAIWWLMLPLVLGRLLWRGWKEPGYRTNLGERFGIYDAFLPNKSSSLIWIHAVSIGETRGAEPIIRTVFKELPDCVILLTHMTPTGRETGRNLFGEYEGRVIQAYLPYDINWMVARFLRHFSPQICMLMETEVWPNMISQCRKQAVPVILANARLSERSYQKALRLPGLFSQAARGIACAAAQTEDDAVRLRKLGVQNVQVTGSVKFDATLPPSLVDNGLKLKHQITLRKILLCASTREGEESLILNALSKHELQDALLLIVPRHPQRFNDVERLIQAKGLRLCRRSTLDNKPVPPDVDVMLGDTMGEMFAYYAACDVAFIGGSLLPLGGQNLIEACAVGKPVLIGPYTFNFLEASENAVAAGAAIRVVDADAMLAEAAHLLQDDGLREEMGKNARHFAEQHRGATQRTVALIKQLLDEKEGGGQRVGKASITD